MTTAVHTAPLEGLAAPGSLSVEYELTGNCQLECTQCCTLSGPKVSHGRLTLTDWQAVVTDIAQLGIPPVQFIGDGPTRSVNLPQRVSDLLFLCLRIMCSVGATGEISTLVDAPSDGSLPRCCCCSGD
jgi:MoaA/NifB/PqqE/SkfB family radical SAM enzyme